MTSSSVDWRNRWGYSWLMQVKGQDCGDCYLFAAVGLVEAMLRIEHNLWSLRSEGDAGDSISFFVDHHPKCTPGGPEEVLNWIKQNGIADPGCWETPQAGTQDVTIAAPDSGAPQGIVKQEAHVAMPTPDRPGRIAKLDDWISLGGPSIHNDMKTWIDTIGPITTCFNCCEDFMAYSDGKPTYPDSWVNDVYICSKDPKNLASSDGHCILVVGYDDDKQAWLIRNSWGPEWGPMNGYAWFGYGQGDWGIEIGGICGIHNKDVNPDPWSKRRFHNGNFYEDGEGMHYRNLEVWTQYTGNQIRHYSHTHHWSLVETLKLPSGSATMNVNDCAGVPSVLSSTYFRNYEVIYQTNSGKLHHLSYDRRVGSPTWTDWGTFGKDIEGIPAFIQINYGAPGNFEVVVRNSQGQLENWWRDNLTVDTPWAFKKPWVLKSTFGSDVLLSGATLVQQWGDGQPYIDIPAALDLVCVNKDGKMQRWWRDDPHADPNNSPANWVPCEKFGENIASPPVMIRSDFMTTNETVPGNYELCVAVNGEIQHWCPEYHCSTCGRPELAEPEKIDWADADSPWTLFRTIKTNVPGTDVQQVLGLIQSSRRRLELIALLTNGKFQHFHYDNGAWTPGHVLP